MITCTFEKGNTGILRHVVTHALAEKNGCILLVKRALFLDEPGKWALPGGFLDRDETAEKGVLRELREETGWSGVIVSLFRINSNPNRPKEDRQNVAMEFIIRPVAQIRKHDNESTNVEWIPIEKLKPDSIAFDHGETIKLYLKHREHPFTLPFLV